MEPDRYQHNHKFYIIGLVCLIVSMALFGTAAYLLPRVAFGLVYTIPDFIFEWTNLVQIAYGLSDKSAGWVIFFLFFLLGFLFSMVTYFMSNRIDNEIFAEEPEVVVEKVKKPHREEKETGPLVLRILLLVGFIFIVAKFFQWAISTH